MRNILIASLIGALLATFTAKDRDYVAEEIEVFHGLLENLDGRPLEFGETKLSVSVFGPNFEGQPRRYRVYVDCDDDGLRLLPHPGAADAQRVWTSFSGSADEDFADLILCPEADPARYNRVVEIMGIGGEMELASRTLVLKSKIGEARFGEYLEAID